jgi:hypothetical protein
VTRCLAVGLLNTLPEIRLDDIDSHSRHARTTRALSVNTDFDLMRLLTPCNLRVSCTVVLGRVLGPVNDAVGHGCLLELEQVVVRMRSAAST